MLLGGVFLFSGFVKAVDPLGSAYKFSDYFNAFGLGFLEGTALPLAILLSSFELLIGFALILGYRRRVVYEVLMWFMLFFILLTLILAIFNPVSDCGCFGDALILTNWETFLKNLVLMVFVVPLFLHRKGADESGKGMKEWLLMAGFYLASCLFSVWNFRNLPLLDFRPYDIGTVVAEEMVIPEGAPMDEYETTLVYRDRESGKETEFTIETYPRDTVRWEFVSSDSRLVKKGYEPPIQDFAIMDPDGDDIVDMILSDPGYSMLMISHDLEKADPEALKSAVIWSQLEMLASDYSFYAITATTSDRTESLSGTLALEYGFYWADEIMLKTVVRSNPGFVLLRNGVIAGKWGYRQLPDIEEMEPAWPELISNAMAPMDQEAQMLMEAGVLENFSYDVIRFEEAAPKLLYLYNDRRRESGVVAIFVMSVLAFLFFAGSIVRPRT